MGSQVQGKGGVIMPSSAALRRAAAVVADAVAHERGALDERQAKALLAD